MAAYYTNCLEVLMPQAAQIRYTRLTAHGKIQITMLPVRYSPVSTVKNHNRQCQESKTCHPILKFPLTYTRRDVDQTPKAPKCSGDQPPRATSARTDAKINVY